MTLSKSGIRRGAEVLWRKQWEGSPWANKMHLMAPESLVEFEEVAENIIKAYFAPFVVPDYNATTISELRAERVKLQGENESLRHDNLRLLNEIDRLAAYLQEHYSTFPFEGSAVDFATQVMDQYRTGSHLAGSAAYANWFGEPVLTPTGSASLDEMAEALRPVKTEADTAALAERVANLEDARANMISVAKLRHKDVHDRIDRVAEIIGNRIGDLVDQLGAVQAATAEAHQRIGRLQVHTGADDMNDLSLEDRNGFRSMLTRIGDLENLAHDRGARLDDLERRQDADDRDRATGDGMPEAPLRAVALEGNDDNATVSVVRQTEPTHENGLQRDAFTVGDEVRLSGAKTLGGHALYGWHRVAGLSPAKDHGFVLQVAEIVDGDTTAGLFWVRPTDVQEVRHGRR